MYADTRYLFLLIRFKQLSPFFNTRFLGESGCKDTTIFRTGKIFFQKKSHRQRNTLSISGNRKEKFSPRPAGQPRKTPPAGSGTRKKWAVRRKKAQNRGKIRATRYGIE
jgi:hypothetical protein